tara:strand:+ start:3435 stop:3905 length:471 start_codon:yes stop_codon:yes gene_type:complete
MILRIRTILDVDDDVIRDLEIDDNSLLEDLSLFITKSYGFKDKEMASFYETDENWKQGAEMNLIELDEEKNFSKETLNSIFNKKKRRLIFVYDFLALWTFYIEVVEFTEPLKHINYPNVVFTKGKVPKIAPNKTFLNSENINDTEYGEDYDYNESY